MTVHDLRRTGATLAAQSGATTREVMRRLGHTTAAVAMIPEFGLLATSYIHRRDALADPTHLPKEPS